MTTPQIFLFRFSHFCEKVEWVADISQQNSQRNYLFPGLHTKVTMALSNQTAVPILKTKEQVVTGSANIADWFCKNTDANQLYFENKESQAKALQIQNDFDELGPAIRGEFFRYLLTKPAAAAKLFLDETKTSQKVFYPQFMRMAAPMLRKKIVSNADGDLCTKDGFIG